MKTLLALLPLLALAPDPGPTSAVLAPSTEVDIGDLERDLAGKDEGRRRSAIGKLIDIGTTEAWLVVVEALANDEPMASEEAQKRLAEATDPKALKALFGKGGLGHKRTEVRRRAAELIGRREAVEPDLLRKALKEKDAEVRRMLLWSAERAALAGALGDEDRDKLEKELAKAVGRDKDAACRGAALFALAALRGADAVGPELARVADDKQPAARCGAARVAGDPGTGAGGLETLGVLAADEDASVRLASLFGLAERGADGERAALELLVARLDGEPRLRMRWTAVETLQGLSGMGYRLDPRPWRRWLEGLPDDWTPAGGAPAAEAKNERGEASVSFAGLPLRSDRLAFLMDFSGSIWIEKDGKVPKDQIGVELERALDRLTPETAFNLIPYTRDPLPWREELVSAKPKEVAAAKAYFADCKARGAGNVYDAIQTALADPEVDTIVILSDGKPSGGERWNIHLMIPALVEQARYRPVAFDSIIVGEPDWIAKHWERLAEATGGRLVDVPLEAVGGLADER